MAPILVASLSLVPGVGHLVVGEKGKAAALFIVDLGIILSTFFVKSQIGYFLICFVYLLVMVPAGIETYAVAKGGVSQFSESKPYISVLLLMTGCSALPLLWQSHVFSKRIKIVWSIAVSVLTIFYFSFLGVYGTRLFDYAKTRFG